MNTYFYLITKIIVKQVYLNHLLNNILTHFDFLGPSKDDFGVEFHDESKSFKNNYYLRS